MMRLTFYPIKFLFRSFFVFVLLIYLTLNNRVFSATNFSHNKIEDFTRSITVRIFSQNQVDSSSGSGVLIAQQKGKYLVLTNHHVVNDRDISYNIQTSDGIYYPGEIVKKLNSKQDISFLAFTSPDKNYQTVNFKNSSNLKVGENVISGGFPLKNNLTKPDQFFLTRGKVNLMLTRSFIGGYQIGYTNLVKNGMSGGPLLNQNGNLIGINGMGKYPVFGNPYTFEDGSTVSDEEWTKMSKLSWAIPLKYILPLPDL